MPVLTFTVKDAHAVMNDLVHQATGSTSINVVDTGSFIDAGTKVLEAGYENLYNSLGVLIGRTIIASRKYDGKLKLIVEDSNAFDNRFRKISYYARDNEAEGGFNTDIYTNLGASLNDESGTGSMWDQNPAIPTERYFFSDFAWMKSHTEYFEQAKIAFTNEADFIRFINGIMVEVQNDIESTLEAKNRAVICDRIAGTYHLAGDTLGPESAVNITSEFNNAHGTNYTSKELRELHTVELEEFFISRFKIDSEKMTNRSTLFHDAMEKEIGSDKYYVMRHTPKDLQRFIYYSPLFVQMKLALNNIFNPSMLSLPSGEGVQYWQSIKDPSRIDIIPALPENADASEIDIPYVIGILYDRDAIMVNNKFRGMYQTNLNPKHLYTNMFWHYKYGVCQDYSENCIIYYMSDTDKTFIDTFIGDGTEDDFELKQEATTITKVTVNGVTQTVSTDYTFADNTITFTNAPANKSVIKVIYT